MQKFFIIIFCLLIAQPVMATTIFPITLTQLSKTANIIFYGKVIKNEVRLDSYSGRVATFTAFEIIEPIKGNIKTSHQIKQVGGQLPGSNVVHKIPGVPTFNLGKEYVIFLPRTSKSGFSSPVGLEQGRFSVYEKNDIKVVNRNKLSDDKDLMFRSTNGKNHTINPSLTEFLQLVRKQITQ